MTPRSLSIAILACVGWVAASDARALGFGRIPETTAFGQALDLAVPLHLDAGESLTAACVQAEVHLGAQRLPPGAVQVTLERRGAVRDELQLRLRSARLVQEPLVAVNLVLGCGASVSRQFVVLADPLALAQPMAAPPQPATPAAARAGRTPAAGPSMRKTSLGAAAEGPRPKPEEAEARLEAATRVVAAQDAALASAARAASAAEAAAMAELRLAAMDTKLKTTRDAAAAQSAAMEQMRQRLASAEDQGRVRSLLAAAVAALALLAFWLGWRVRTLQREPAATPLPRSAKAEESTPQTLPAVAVAAPPPPIATPPGTEVVDALTRPLSVDELIDLEQQAEFFLVLGEAQAAADLLMSHLLGSGGSSPLPYLKLLEIFRRRGDRDAYERTRRRFGQRFNAVAPDWDTDPEQGLDLLDYPAVLAALQAAWPRPLQAMAELENLLFHKRSGELFELPAYRDVLTLYAVARDLHRQLDRPGAEVDVLLPLSGRDGATPSIFDGLGAAEERPKVPVDRDPSRPPLRAAQR